MCSSAYQHAWHALLQQHPLNTLLVVALTRMIATAQVPLWPIFGSATHETRDCCCCCPLLAAIVHRFNM
jgi:hypothetical protein